MLARHREQLEVR